MDNSEFPPNSEVSKRPESVEDRNIERVTSGEVIRKKKSFRKQFKETFVAGDVRTAIRYAMFDIALPAARDMVLETMQQGLEKWFMGESRRRGGSTPPQHGPYGNIPYERYSRPTTRMSSPQRTMSRLARARHDFGDLVLDSRTEAEEVIERLFDLVDRYGTATVADLYDLVGLTASHTDNKWGWSDLRGAGVSRTRDGYLLDLPDPRPI